jgi:hypothetical protein
MRRWKKTRLSRPATGASTGRPDDRTGAPRAPAPQSRLRLRLGLLGLARGTLRSNPLQVDGTDWSGMGPKIADPITPLSAYALWRPPHNVSSIGASVGVTGTSVQESLSGVLIEVSFVRSAPCGLCGLCRGYGILEVRTRASTAQITLPMRSLHPEHCIGAALITKGTKGAVQHQQLLRRFACLFYSYRQSDTN